MPTQKSLKRNLYQKTPEESLPEKNQTIFLPKTISKDSTKETLKIHSLPKTYPTPIAWRGCDLDFVVRKGNLGGGAI